MYYSFLEKLTIVIYSFNRHKYLIRTLKYWSNFNAKVLVLDGSKEKLENDCLSAKNIKYIHDPRSLYDRLLSSVNFIDTNFIILGCDDEFYLPSALSSCVEFLEKNKEYSSCGGRTLGFGRNSSDEFYGRKVYSKLENFSLIDNDPLKRAKQHMSNYEPAHVYSVMHTKTWRIISKYIFEKEYNLYAALELQIEFLLPIAGKSKIIPELMTMRNLEVPAIRGTSPSLDLSSGRLKWWFSDKMKNERQDFFIRTSRVCKKILSNPKKNLDEKKILEIFEIFFSKTYLKKNSFLKRNLSKLIPQKFKKVIKYLIKKLNFYNMSYYINTITKKKTNLIVEANNMQSNHVLVNFKEFDFIYKILKNEKN